MADLVKTQQEMENDGYVRVSDPNLRVQLWEKHEGPVGSRWLTDEVLWDSVLMTLRDPQHKEYDERDYVIMSQNADFLEILSHLGQSLPPEVLARVTAGRFVGNALRQTP